jgi:YidC/Oxa1 family membrane protein insertase
MTTVLALIVGSPLTPIENALRTVLDWLHTSLGLSWAWSIVGLTVIVRMLLVPLTVKQIHSMQRMQRFAPQMKELQRKYKGDRQKQNEELMKFYKENNINPAASCLPMLLQIPIFFALYLVLRHFSQHPPGGKAAITHGDFGWMHGLVPSVIDHVNAHWSGYMLIVIYAASQIASTFFMSATVDRMQRILFMVMPVAFIPFLLRFPTGLLLYWLTSNLWVVGQGLITRRLVPKTPAPAPKRSSRTPPKEDGASAPPAAKQQAPANAAQAPRRVKRKKKSRR